MILALQLIALGALYAAVVCALVCVVAALGLIAVGFWLLRGAP